MLKLTVQKYINEGEIVLKDEITLFKSTFAMKNIQICAYYERNKIL